MTRSTLGHLDIITRSSRIFDHVIVAVMINPKKKTSFTVEERIDLLRRATAGLTGVKWSASAGCWPIMPASGARRPSSRACGP